jgi:hypothetical protein
MKTKTSSVSRPVTESEYGPTSISDGVRGELHAAAAYGDLADGPHGTFIKMPAGYVSPTHIHTEDYWAVVVKTYPSDAVARALVQRATVTRQWQLFLNRCAVLLIPVSAELPFPDGLDLQGDAAFNECGMRSFCCERPLRWVCRYWRSRRDSWVKVRSACKSLPAAIARICVCLLVRRSRLEEHRPLPSIRAADTRIRGVFARWCRLEATSCRTRVCLSACFYPSGGEGS